jgi:hypothetical protein
MLYLRSQIVIPMFKNGFKVITLIHIKDFKAIALQEDVHVK